MEKGGTEQLSKERLQLLWVSAAESEKFASKIYETQKIMENVTSEENRTRQKVFSKVEGAKNV
ncbi:MAG: hypothetical protein QXZ47_00230 [Candidatus Bathyarchaeia archaeon]